MFHQLASQLLLLKGVTAFLPHARSANITWVKCNESISDETEIPIFCAKLPVPLDYSNKSRTETLSLDLIKVDATKKPVKGTILFNFGGPGGSGIKALPGKAEGLLK